jgi:host factor-I protein
MIKTALQDVFLNVVRKDKTEVIVFLMSGVKLQGIITWFDHYSMLLKKGPISQLIYKHAVATIVPNEPVCLNRDEDPLPLHHNPYHHFHYHDDDDD